jgi:putative peptide zinc metalloprotease protein
VTVLPGLTPGRGDGVSSRSGAPARADGVELIGAMVGSGYRVPPALVRRVDGQTFQLTPLLYLVLSAVDGARSYDEVGEQVSLEYGRTVTGDNVRSLVDQQLRPMGLLAKDDGSQPDLKKSNPLLALRFKYAVSDPERTRRLTAPFARLFNPVLVVLVLLAFVSVSCWVLFDKGLASATSQAFDKPGLLLLVVGVTVVSAGFHEFGHAAAARRGGATPGVMGAGIYLVWPAFYTDVTDSYRLGRGGRVRTDLGGLYFNAIVAVLIAGLWWVTRWDALLLVVATQILQMIRQLTPLVRFDGYHVLADVTGVPDLFHRIKPTLLGVLPWRWRDAEARALKPWARAVVTLWVLAVVPLLGFSMFTMVIAVPRLLGTAWRALGAQSAALSQAWADTDLLGVAGRGIAVIAVAFPVLATGVLLLRLVRQVTVWALRRTKGRPLQRVVAGVVAVAVAAGLAWAWWPNAGSYRPVQPYERGTLAQAAEALPVPVAFRPQRKGLVEGQEGTIRTAWANGDPRPTREKPELAMVLVPRVSAGPGLSGGPGAPTQGTSTNAPVPWVFPFGKPLAPGVGDNQAMAVNTTDDTIRYDVAFALVWVDDDSPALNTNEAYAFSSCTNCATVSVAFQVVLVIGDNHVAAPQNISAAVNHDCVNCLSYALATQLFVTLDGPLSDAGTQQISALWQQIAKFGTHITEVPIDQIREQLSAFEDQILQIVEKEQGPLTPVAPSSTDADGDAATTGVPSPGLTTPGDPTASSTPARTGTEPTDPASTDVPSPTATSATGGGGTVPPAPTPSAATTAAPSGDDPTTPQSAP